MPEQTDQPTQEAIAALAYQIWEYEGQPEDQAGEYWQRAEEQLAKLEHPPTGIEAKSGYQP